MIIVRLAEDTIFRYSKCRHVFMQNVKAGAAFGRQVARQIDRQDRYMVIRFTAAVI